MKTRRKGLSGDSAFRIVERNWGYLPKRVKRAVVEVVRAFEPGPRAVRFGPTSVLIRHTSSAIAVNIARGLAARL